MMSAASEIIIILVHWIWNDYYYDGGKATCMSCVIVTLPTVLPFFSEVVVSLCFLGKLVGDDLRPCSSAVPHCSSCWSRFSQVY